MLPLFDVAAARAWDTSLSAVLSSYVLMEHAGFAAAATLLRTTPDAAQHTLVLGGPGNNGGDAWVLARALRCAGLAPRVWILGDSGAVAGDAAKALHALRATGVEPRSLDSTALPAFSADLEASDVLVDGLFGVGLSRPLEGLVAEVVRRINNASAYTVALDLPSGVCATTGQVLGCAIKADLTVTFAAYKPGLLAEPGRALAGTVEVLGLGMPAPPLDLYTVLEASDLPALRPARAASIHKGSAGRVAIIGGAAGQQGAALLAARGALRAGAGLVTWLQPEERGNSVDVSTSAQPEVRHSAVAAGDALTPSAPAAAPGLPEVMTGWFSTERTDLSAWHAAVLGPGYGRHALAASALAHVALAAPCPLVLDADALFALGASGLARLTQAAGPRVLTPHAGEAAHVLGTDTPAINNDRFAAARALATTSGHVAVLKGPGTLIAAPDGRLAACPYGSPALATGGTGDVLAGMVGALLAQGAAPFEAACAAVLWHALASHRHPSDRGLLASDLADALVLTCSFPQYFGEINR